MQQSVEIDLNEHIRRDLAYRDVDIWSFYKSIHPNVYTLGDILYQGFLSSNDGPRIGQISSRIITNETEIKWISYSSIIEMVHLIGTYLCLSLNLTPGISKVIILSISRLEHVCVEHACYIYGLIVVSVHSTSNLSTILDVLERTEPEVLVVDTMSRISSIEKEIFLLTSIKKIIIMDNETFDNEKFETVSNILNKKEKSIAIPTIDPNSVAMFLMTSGTTGKSKLAMITHENVLATIKSETDRRRRENIFLEPSDRHVSILPMSHCFERLNILLLLLSGAQIVFCSSQEKLLDYMALVKPTRLYIVPRLLNNIYEKHIIRISTEANSQKNQVNPLLVSEKVKKMFGGLVKSMLTASASIAPEILDFFRVALGIRVTESYAQTESVGAGTWIYATDITNYGTVGVPTPTAEIKLIDVDGTPYKSSQQQGEICIRGPSVFKGYYKDEVNTRETIDSKGWLHTGDVGEWTSSGTLRIIDRCKSIFKLNNGKYVAPEVVERVYLRSRWVTQIFVDGKSSESSVVAIIVPDEEHVRKHYSISFINDQVPSFSDLCKDPRLKEIIHQDLICLANVYQLPKYEIPSNIHLHPELFTQANGLATSTMKIRRPSARIYFGKEIDQLYLRINARGLKTNYFSKL